MEQITFSCYSKLLMFDVRNKRNEIIRSLVQKKTLSDRIVASRQWWFANMTDVTVLLS